MRLAFVNQPGLHPATKWMRVLWLTGVLGTAEPSHAWIVGLFSDAACSQCSISIPRDSTAVIYAVLTVDWDTGTAGTAFRITGLPQAWTYSIAALPGRIFDGGDPFGYGVRAGLEFPAPGCHRLFAISITATTEEAGVTLVTTGHPLYPICGERAYIVVCDDPLMCDTFLCPPPAVFHINSSNESCALALVEETWTAVRRLYR
jgi:hypothetical protein